MNFPFSSDVLDFGTRDPRRMRQFSRGFWLFCLLLTGVVIYVSKSTSLSDYIGALILILACLTPAYLWTRQVALGLPFFPLLTLSHIMFYAIPLISAHPGTHYYSESERLGAALWLAFAILGGMIVWLQFVTKVPTPPKKLMQFQLPGGRQFLLDFGVTFLLLGILFVHLILNHGFLASWRMLLPFGIISLIRMASGAVAFLCIFLGFYRIGMGRMSLVLRLIFLGAFLGFVVDQVAGLILMSAALLCIPALFGYILAKRRIPFFTLVGVGALFAYLNISKGEVRYLFWSERDRSGDRVFISDYDELFLEWNRQSWSILTTGEATFYNPDVNSLSVVERASLMHIYLIPYTQSPTMVDFMWGGSYKVIPQLLVPRFLNPKKPFAHEGQVQLNIHYGLQDRETAQRTFLAWGLVPEAQANFGTSGVVGLFLALGLGLGWLTRWTMNVPILSYRSLVAAIFLLTMIDTETVASLFVTSTFQSLAIVSTFALVFMRSMENPEYRRLRANLDFRQDESPQRVEQPNSPAVNHNYN
ncbi:MAG: hypothetical protein SFY68_05805 [Candidatus Sumerlaeia bacterium]|nr:hypothetical protein [Candidatus Sumerlaeia bacterium]